MKEEIGGYLEWETYIGNEYHNDCLKLNSGRNCLRYIIRAREIKSIWLPRYICSSIYNVCIQEKIRINWYQIDPNFIPDIEEMTDNNSYLYLINYFGQLDDETIYKLCLQFTNVIVDYSQAFFQRPLEGIDSIYTCRKFFGVPDGAYLYTKEKKLNIVETETVGERFLFLLGRYERRADEFYCDFQNNEKYIENQPIRNMSYISENLMRSFDYNYAKERRNLNFQILTKAFQNINKLFLKIPDGPFMYPLLLDNGETIRRELNKLKIYVPTLWPDVFAYCRTDSYEYQLAKNLVPLVCDQRYSDIEMDYIIKSVMQIIS